MISSNRKPKELDGKPFKKFHISEYPSNFIPKDAKIFVGVDMGAPDGDCTVRGFRDVDGTFHIQEVDYA